MKHSSLLLLVLLLSFSLVKSNNFKTPNKEKGMRTPRRFGNMAGRRIYSQLFVLYSSSVPADEQSRAVVLIIIFCNFIQQRFRADDFQIPPNRQAVAVMRHPTKFEQT